MSNAMEAFALGNLNVEIKGKFKIALTDPVTNKVLEQIEQHNHIYPRAYNMLRSTIARCFGLSRAQYVTYPKGMDVSTYNTDVSANLFSRIQLTDGTAPAGQIPDYCSYDGTVIAEGGSSESAASGSIYGAATYVRDQISANGYKRRWDWGSANGNGRISRIQLLAPENAPQILSWGEDITNYTETFLGSWAYSDDCEPFFRYELSGNKLKIYEYNLVGGTVGFIKNYIYESQITSGFSPTYVWVSVSKANEDTLLVLTSDSSAQNRCRMITFSRSTGTMLTDEAASFGSEESFIAAYCRTDGKIEAYTMYSKYGDRRSYKCIYTPGAGYTKSQISTVEYPQRLTRIVSVTDDVLCGVTNNDTMLAIWRDGSQYKGYSHTLMGSRASCLRTGNTWYAIYGSTDVKYPLIQARRIDDLKHGQLVTADQLLSTPVIKNDQSMYVEYTWTFC